MTLFLTLGLMLTTSYTAMAGEIENQEKWQFQGDLYLWGAGIKSDLSNGAEIDFSFSDIMDNLDLAFMGSIGARKGKWQFFSDVIYMDLSGNKRVVWSSLLQT